MIVAKFFVILFASMPGAAVLDQPPGPLQKDYAPADGSVVSVNPPPFIWVPAEEDLLYMLEIAPRADFSGAEVIRLYDIPISTVALPEPLKPGNWYWRYAVQEMPGLPDFQDATFSRTRAFIVPETATLLPFPDIGAAIRRIPVERPRLFFLAGELEDYRRRVREGDLRTFAEEFAGRNAGRIGEELVAEPPYVAGEGAERGRNYSQIIRTTRPDMDGMEQFAMAYLLTQEPTYGREAKRRILHFFSWDPEGSTQYWHNDEPAMWVMMRGVRAYDWTYDLFAPEEREAVERIMKIRAQQFFTHLRYRRRFHTNPHESHAGRTIGFLGEACIAFAHEWPESRDWLEYVLTNYWNVYPAWGREDGGWHEGPSYYGSYMSFVLHFLVPLRKATGIDLMQKPFFQNTPYYLLYTNPPYAKISPFGDGEHGPASSSRGQVMYAFSTLLRNPYARWYGEAQGAHRTASLLGIVLRDDAVESKSPAELPQARYFPGIGLVSLHTALGNAQEDVHFLIHSDPYGPISHAHADQNAFTLEAFGEALAIASGYYPWYGSDHHRYWQWESKSSNTVTFDGGQGQVIRDPKSKGIIRGFEHGVDYDYVAADATEAYQGRLSRFVRHVVHVRPGIFVLFDDLEAPVPRTFEWRLHSLSEMTLPEHGTMPAHVLVAQGNARLDVRFLSPKELDFEQTVGFEHPPEHGEPDQWHLVAALRQPSEVARFLTVLVPYKGGDETRLPQITGGIDPGGWKVGIADQSGTHLVAFRAFTESAAPDGTRYRVAIEVTHRDPKGERDKSGHYGLIETITGTGRLVEKVE